MPDSTLESILDALLAALKAAAPDGALVARNSLVPEIVPPAGAMILRDGVPGEPAMTFSPVVYEYEHRAEVEIMVQGATAAIRDAAFDTLRQAVGQAIEDDPTLTGTADWSEVQAPPPQTVIVDRADPVKAATVPVILYFETENPLK